MDQGKTWKKNPSPLIQGESSQGIFSITIFDDNEVVAVGGDYLKPQQREGNLALFKIKEKIWDEILIPPFGYRSGVAFYINYHWLISVGPSGSDFSSDGGKTWENFSTEGFHAVKASQKGESIWASGAKGKIARLKY